MGKIKATITDIYRKVRLSLAIRHVYGPKRIKYAKNELIVVCPVRNGETHIKSFIEYYFSKGIKHIVFLDNGSSDKGIAIAKSYSNITVLRTNLPFNKYETLMRNYLMHRFSKNRWCLCMDIDERFDWPYSYKVSIGSLLDYLNNNKYTAVVGQVLDMFSDKPILGLKNIKDIRKAYNYYDISDIKKLPYPLRSDKEIACGKAYPQRNAVSNGEIKTNIGGIRKKIFGIDVDLTTHPLLFCTSGEKPLLRDVRHNICNARIADLSCVIFHYKFLGDFYEKAKFAVKEKNHWNDSYEYRKYLAKLNAEPNLTIKSAKSRKFKGINELVNNGFLTVSDDYKDWVHSQKWKRRT